MKRKPKHLDVDFIGGLGPLSPEEEKLLAEYFKKLKLKTAKRKARTKKTAA